MDACVTHWNSGSLDKHHLDACITLWNSGCLDFPSVWGHLGCLLSHSPSISERMLNRRAICVALRVQAIIHECNRPLACTITRLNFYEMYLSTLAAASIIFAIAMFFCGFMHYFFLFLLF